MRRDLLLYTLCMIVVSMIHSCQDTYPDDSAKWLIIAVFLVPVWGFYLWRGFQIFRKSEDYIFCRCKLAQPHHRLLTKTMYFTILIEEPGGRTIVRETHAIFAPYGAVGPLMEDYVNSTVTIGYNPETEMVVVIG